MVRSSLKYLLYGALTIAACGAILSFVLLGPRNPLMGFSFAMQRQFASVQTGDTELQVVQKLGVPSKKGATFLLPQRHGFESAFQKAEESNARMYYLWINGVNWFYCIGFDGAGKVAVKGEGHS